MDADKTTNDIEVIWQKLLKAFSNWKAVKPKKSWLKTGLSERLGYRRMENLERSLSAKTFSELTQNLSDDELKYLHNLSRINLEQVTPAARISLIINVTSIIAFFVLVNQMLPGYIAEIMQDLTRQGPNTPLAYGILAGFITFIPIGIFITMYCFGGVAGARDLKNLIELKLARRNLDIDESGATDTIFENVSVQEEIGLD